MTPEDRRKQLAESMAQWRREQWDDRPVVRRPMRVAAKAGYPLVRWATPSLIDDGALLGVDAQGFG